MESGLCAVVLVQQGMCGSAVTNQDQASVMIVIPCSNLSCCVPCAGMMPGRGMMMPGGPMMGMNPMAPRPGFQGEPCHASTTAMCLGSAAEEC